MSGLPPLVGAVPEYLGRIEAARYIRCSLGWLAEKTASGEISSLKVGRKRLYRKTDLDAWLGRHVGGV
jgi:excisionase family DNA binding protein